MVTGKNSLTVIDNRTGKSYELPITDGAIRAMDLRQIRSHDDDFGLMSYDPAFQNTASCRSAVSFIDGERGVLTYRGYPIQDLAEQSTYLEVAYLLLEGRLPKEDEYDGWVQDIMSKTYVHESLQRFMSGFQYDAHPMNMLTSTISALAAFYPEAKQIEDAQERRQHAVRLLAKMPTLAAWAYRHRRGYPFIYPDPELSYTGNFLAMLKRMTERAYEPHPVLERALDVLFVLHADHEQNCSTHTARSVGSSRIDPYSAVSAAASALYGPLHGGANEAVITMLRKVERKENVPTFVSSVKNGEGRLMGFGHRIYKSYDPRAKVIKRLATQVFEVTGTNPLLDIALELERIALEDEYFVSRKLYPNVDFYSGLIYEAIGFPIDMFTVLFAIPRVAGWLAQWNELVEDKEQKIARPRQIYTGSDVRPYAPMAAR